RLPVAAIVPRRVETEFGTGEEETAAAGVGAHHAGEVLRIDPVGDAGPGGAVVGRLVEVGLEVVRLVARGGEIGARLVVGARFDLVDLRPLGKPLGRHVRPGLPTIPGDLHQAVVRAGPDRAGGERGLGDGEDRAVVLDAGVVLGDRSARRSLPALVVARQVGGDRRPALPAVGALEQHLRRGVEGMRIVGRKQDREVPLEAVLEIAGAPAHHVLGPGVDVARLAGGVVLAVDEAAVGAAVDDLRVGGIGHDVAALAARGDLPVGGSDAGALAAGQDAQRRVVLLRAEEAVGEVSVGGDAVELRRRLVVLAGPGLAAVGG